MSAETITVEEDRERQQRHYEDIVELRHAVAKSRAKYDRAKTAAKKAKEVYEDDVAELMDLIARGPDEQLQLFPTTMPDWKRVKLEGNVELSPKVLELLAEAKITTLGDLVYWTDEHPLSDIKGIGPKKVEEIEEATMKYWADHPDMAESLEADRKVDQEVAEEVAEALADDYGEADKA